MNSAIAQLYAVKRLGFDVFCNHNASFGFDFNAAEILR